MTDVLGFCDGLDATEQGALLSDWHAAVDKCIFELTLKTAHWQMLPWCLAAVGHPDPDIARAFLRKSRDKYLKTEAHRVDSNFS